MKAATSAQSFDTGYFISSMIQLRRESEDKTMVKPARQGRFVLVAGLEHCGTGWLAEALNRPEIDMVGFHEQKVRILKSNYLDLVKHQQAKGIDERFAPYFDFIRDQLAKYHTVVDSNSWPTAHLPIVDKIIPVNHVVYIIRNGIKNVNSLVRHTFPVGEIELRRKIWPRGALNMLTKTVEIHPDSAWTADKWQQRIECLRQDLDQNYESWTDFERFAFNWRCNEILPEWLKMTMGDSRVSVVRFEDLLEDEAALRKLINTLSDAESDAISDDALREIQGRDVNRKIKGNRDPEKLWKSWSVEDRGAFKRLCERTMTHFGYDMPSDSLPDIELSIPFNIFIP